MKKSWLYNIALSDERSYRVQRHLYFCLAVFIYHVFRIGIFFPAEKLWKGLPAVIFMAFVWGTCFNMFFTYVTVYYLVPKYFIKKKYLLFTIGLVLLLCVLQSAGFFHQYLIQPLSVRSFIGTSLKSYRPGFIRLFGNPPLICGFFLALRIIKNWYKEQMQHEMLVKENANAELQLLKAQVHPHFLFNTLNNIYSFTLSKSPEASSLISKLSDTLQYMISDCKTDLVPLEKELKMLEDYIGLEKVRYGDRLEMWTDIRGDYKDKLIAPLIMIPFVENCFKHGSSAMRGRQWIQLSIHIKETMLHFQLKNSKPPEPVQIKNKSGIGLINVKKRLALLYPDHQLDISSAEGVFSVYLQLELQTANRVKKELINKYSGTTI